jgi:hypothetical protein
MRSSASQHLSGKVAVTFARAVSCLPNSYFGAFEPSVCPREPRVDTWEAEKWASLQFAQAWFSDDLDGELPALARCRVATAAPVGAVRPHPLSSDHRLCKVSRERDERRPNDPRVAANGWSKSVPWRAA